jgi:hypothetical protein
MASSSMQYHSKLISTIDMGWFRFVHLGNCLGISQKETVPLNTLYFVSRDSAFDIATSYGLDDQGVGVRVPVGKKFSLLHIIQTGSGVHPTSYPMGTGDFPRG